MSRSGEGQLSAITLVRVATASDGRAPDAAPVAATHARLRAAAQQV